ncbi:MAG: dihydroorotate dehydrogenase electron transfer subunit [Methanobacteriota archaeon]|nr:MAG: dihydroorotate dehydrogenase electron transfer subunit [Euryarchaeota archaeon]
MTELRVFTIADQIDEAKACRTVRFRGSLHADPGQFVMVWLPREDEFPMSVSYVGEGFGLTYKIVGEGTRSLSTMNPGEKVGIRGPYGRGFEVQGRRMLAIAGGVGMAVIAPLVDLAMEERADVDLVLGAKTESELIMKERCEMAGANVHISTDDGSSGTKGLATDIARRLLQTAEYDCVCACGPEKMIVSAFRLSEEHGLPFQASLERYIKCGIGICDSCAIDGRHVCSEGPVFSGDVLASLEDLGRRRLSPSGRIVSLD